jgi:hypothetical protein
MALMQQFIDAAGRSAAIMFSTYVNRAAQQMAELHSVAHFGHRPTFFPARARLLRCMINITKLVEKTTRLFAVRLVGRMHYSTSSGMMTMDESRGCGSGK